MVLLERNSEDFSDDDFTPLLAPESQQAKALYAKGVLRQIWHRADVKGACLLMEASAEDELTDQIQTLPLVQRGMLHVRIIPMRPYAGFTN